MSRSRRPPSVTYRFRKLVRRNKGAFAGAAAVVVAVLAGLGLATFGFILANVERELAIARSQDAQQQRFPGRRQFPRGTSGG